jgi:hypothetical protein
MISYDFSKSSVRVREVNITFFTVFCLSVIEGVRVQYGL